MIPFISKDKVNFLTVDDNDAEMRLDNYLGKKLKGVPKSHIYKLIRAGSIRINKKRAEPKAKLAAGDQIRVPPLRIAAAPPAKPSNSGKKIDLPVIFEDDGLLVIDKPAGVAVHGGSGISLGVIEALRRERPEARYLELIHRLDKDTSGVLLIAKKRRVLLALQKQIRERTPEKIYLALSVAPWPHDLSEVNAPLHKYTAKTGEKMVRVDPEGTRASTRFEVLENIGHYSLLKVTLMTGRTHQIRVHAQSVGAPLAGDERYGDYALNRRLQKLGLKRMFLHAHELTVTYPEEERRTFTSPLPAALENFLATLRKEGEALSPGA